MEGITILNTIQRVTETAFNFKGALSVSLIIATLWCLVYFFDNALEFVPLASGVIVSLITGIIAGNTFLSIPIEYKEQYQVIISENVSLQEFNKQYKIISQEGKIFTIEKRKEE